jgi:cytochrome oxidase Cu insertion factor (SCO1/SenC/PrrC family)
MAARSRHGAEAPACCSCSQAGWRRRTPSHVRSTFFLASGLAWLFLAVAASAAHAHEAPPQIVPDARVELTFGRTEDYDYDPPEPGSYRLPSLGPAADGILVDTEGRQRSLHRAMAGRITVLAFIYTRCSDPEGCPLSMALFHDLHFVGEKDPAVGEALQLITASFDPAHDTAEVLKEFAKAHLDGGHSADSWLFLTATSHEELAPILSAYRQPIGRKTDTDDPFGPITHRLRVYLVDSALRIRNIYSLGFLDPRLVITDVRTLLLEEAKK